MPDLKKFSHLKVAPAIFFPNNHFNVRNVGNFIVLYWPAALNVKLLQMIETQAVVFLMYFKESFTVMFVACWVIFKVYRLLSLERFWWSSHWYKFLIRCGYVCAALTESKTVFFSLSFFSFLSVHKGRFALQLWKRLLQCEKHLIFSSSPVCSPSETPAENEAAVE